MGQGLGTCLFSAVAIVAEPRPSARRSAKATCCPLVVTYLLSVNPIPNRWLPNVLLLCAILSTAGCGVFYNPKKDVIAIINSATPFVNDSKMRKDYISFEEKKVLCETIMASNVFMYYDIPAPRPPRSKNLQIDLDDKHSITIYAGCIVASSTEDYVLASYEFRTDSSKFLSLFHENRRAEKKFKYDDYDTIYGREN
jgi:hypothetical protein